MARNNPYVGLRPFDTDESLLFFGRDDQTLELLQRLHNHSFVAVVGSSGSGKSSLLRAGLIPALMGGFLVNNSDRWKVAIMKPGQRPLYNLAETVLQQTRGQADSKSVTQLVDKMGALGATAIIDIIEPLRKQEQFNFFLLIDQFEELFRFSMNQSNVAKKDAAIDFVNIFLELTKQRSVPFYVVLTMRSDFIGDCSQFHGLPEAMNKSQYLVPRLTRQQLKKVIEGPAKLFGGSFEASLTSILLNHIGKVRDELPVLQHSLMRMWDHEINTDKGGSLDLKDYNKIGGIENALSNHADEAFLDKENLSKRDRKIVRNLFKGLTAIDDHGRKIRRPALLSELSELTGEKPSKLLSIIEHFVRDDRSFLIVENVGETEDKSIDISHESLIRQWRTLERWVEQEDEKAKIYLKLIDAKKEYDLGNKGLLDDLELQKFVAWRERSNPNAAWAKRYQDGFEESMAYFEKSEQAQKRKRTRKKILIFTSILAFFVATFFVYNYRINEANKDLAARLQNNAQKLLATNPTKALLLEMAAYDISGKEEYRDSAVAIYEGPHSFYKITNTKDPYPLEKAKKFQDTLLHFTISPKEDKLFAEYSSGNARLIARDGSLIVNFDSVGVGAKVFSPDGTKFALGEKSGKISVWDDNMGRLNVYEEELESPIGVTAMVFSTAAKKLVTGNVNGNLTLWDSVGNKVRSRDLGQTVKSPVALLKYAKNDTILFAGSFFNSAVLTKNKFHQLTTASGEFGSYDESGLLYAAAFDSLNNDLVTGGEDRKVRIWYVREQGQNSHALAGHDREVTFVDFSYHNKNRYIVSAALDHTIILWNDSGILQKFVGHEGNVTSVTLGPDGTTLISKSDDLTTREWPLNNSVLRHQPMAEAGVKNEDGSEKISSSKNEVHPRLSLEDFLKSGKIEPLSDALKKEYGIQ